MCVSVTHNISNKAKIKNLKTEFRERLFQSQTVLVLFKENFSLCLLVLVFQGAQSVFVFLFTCTFLHIFETHSYVGLHYKNNAGGRKPEFSWFGFDLQWLNRQSQCVITLVFHGGEEGNIFLCSDVFEPFAATTAWLKSDVVRRKEEDDDFWVASEPLSQASWGLIRHSAGARRCWGSLQRRRSVLQCCWARHCYTCCCCTNRLKCGMTLLSGR